MAKTKKIAQVQQKGAKKATKRTMTMSDTRVSRHVRMIMDPCNAPLGPNAYRGSDGFVTRFRNVNTIVVNTTATNYIHVYYPAYNGVWTQAIADGSAALTPNYTTAGPGQAFLLATADSQRVVGACVEVNYTGSELNRQGIVYTGVVPAAALVGASINTIVALLQASRRTPDSAIETKYIPSSSDEEYWPTGSVAPNNPGDLNVIVTLVINPGVVNLDFQVVNTLIAEWRPRFGQGLQIPTPNTADAPAGLEHVRTIISRYGDWWVRSARELGHIMNTGSRVVNATRALGQTARFALMAA